MNPTELNLRREALITLALITAVASACYLAFGTAGGWQSRLYPYDGIVVLAISIICTLPVLSRTTSPKRVAFFAAWYLAIAVQPLFYAAQRYGITHPIMALFILSLLAGALLVGNRFPFLLLWTGFHCLWVVIVGIDQFNGTGIARLTLAQVVAYSAFWIILYAGSGGLAWAMARYLQQSLDAAYRQNLVLTRSLDALAAEPNADKFLGQVLTAVAETVKVQYAPLFIYDAERDELRTHIAFGEGSIFTPEKAATNTPAPLPAHTSPLWQELVATKDFIYVPDPANDPRFLNKEMLRRQRINNILAIPLVLGQECLGYVAINSLTLRRYGREELDLLRALAQLITLAMQLTRLSAQAQDRAVLDERNRMARDIHDTLAQGFTGIMIQLEAAEDAMTDTPADTARHLMKAKALARDSLAEARRSVRALRPAALEQQSWIAALQSTVQPLTQNSGVTITWHTDSPLPPLSRDTDSELFRIGQEAVTNALRHADATALTISVHANPATLTLTVQDNGKGFDTTAHLSGFGITGMHERAARIGATLTVESTKDTGTIITCAVSL